LVDHRSEYAPRDPDPPERGGGNRRVLVNQSLRSLRTTSGHTLRSIGTLAIHCDN